MSSAKRSPSMIIPYLLCCLYVISDAVMPKCKDDFDKCQCHSSYTNDEIDGEKDPKNCLKLHSKTFTWFDAEAACKAEFSYLLYNYTNSSLIEDFRRKGVDLIWIGIRRISGFYVSIAEEKPYKESIKQWGKKWGEDEPFHDCVALHLSAGYLVTRPCATELEFVCQNNGFPVYPVVETLACPEDWFMFYQLPMASKKCIKPFKRSKAIDNSLETCSKYESNVAEDEVYYALYSNMSALGIADFEIDENNAECVTKLIGAVLGGSVISNLTCSDALFICEKDTGNVSATVRILPEYSDSLSSVNTSQGLLTCDVSIHGWNISGKENQLRFIWFQNGIPVPVDSHLHQLSFYADPTKVLSTPVIRQGTYRCGVMIEGLQDTYVSKDLNYFFSDVSTYILTLEGAASDLGYFDFSRIGFRKFRNKLNETMTTFTAGLPEFFPAFEWDYQKAWSNGNNATVQLLLYNKRNDSQYSTSRTEKELYQALRKHFLQRQPISGKSASFRLLLQSADVCFEEVVPSSKTSHNGILLWKDTVQTKSAVSEPMCLNDWKLVTRECRPSVTDGARWISFNYARCTKYQPAVKDLEITCPNGFKELDRNLCYRVFKENHTLKEAKEICQNRSSYLMDLKSLNNRRIISELEISSTYWFSEKTGSGRIEEKSYNLLDDKNSNFNCFMTKRIKETPTYSFVDCNYNEKHSFVCIHQPLILLETQIFSKSWKKFAHQNSCYYIENSERTWEDASKSCQAFPVKSRLLKSIQYLEEYLFFKVLLQMLTPFLQGSSWWINLFQDKDSLKWLNSPEETVTFVDWEAHTDFMMSQSGGVLTFGSPSENSIRWSLRDLSTEEGFICEMQDCSDTRPTFVYIEDRTTKPTGEDVGIISKLSLHCVPSGWFVSGSISWFKDGVLIEDPPYEINMNRLTLSLKPTRNLMDILRFQGYYWCSVDQVYSYKQIFSPKVLFSFPGLHTFVLHMKSEVSEISNCSHSISLKLPYIDLLNKHLLEILPNGSVAVLRDASCTSSELHYYDHIYFSEELGGANEIRKIIENSFTYGNDVLLELLEQLQVNKEDISIRSTTKCLREKSYHNKCILNWPETPIGQSALPEEICVTADGDALERKCLGDFDVGAFWSPVEKDCSVVVHSDLTLNLQKLARTNITSDNILNSSLDMEILTATSKDLKSMDVQYVAQILRNMENIPDIKPQVLRSVVNTIDNVISAKISASDRRITLSNTSSRISSAMENIATNLQTDGQVVKEAGNNIAVCVMPFSSNITLIPTGGVLENWGSNVTTLFNDSDRDPYSHFETFEAAVLLPDNLLAQKQSSNLSNIPIIIRRNINFLKDIEVISPVIDVSVGHEPVYDVDPPLELFFKVPKISQKQKTEFFQCVFWDQRLNDNYGGWSYKGCYSSYVDSTHMRCFCNHLTSFAVILELKPGTEILKVHQTSLSIITYIGCSLSIFGLGVIIVTFISFRKWRKDVKHKVLFNLSLALISFLLIFLIGIEKTESRYGCMTVAVLLHFFMLASFTWMLVEAFMQYLSLVKVIGTYIPRLIQKAMIFAWGVPLTIVGIVLSINYDLYNSRHKYCWLSDNIFYLAVAAPILSMLALNFVIFALILYSNTCGRSTKYLRTNQNERQETIARAKAVFCVSILLGLTWIFGFLAVEGAKLIFQYLFAITTTLQGFFIFIFFVFRQKSTRDLWLNLVRTAPSPEISHITGGTEVTSRGLNHRSVQSRLSRVTYKAKLSYISFNG
ncbi:uncharacterized protein LOC129966790 isoform X1 [Argiope bruennichi]|uniref:uncharacterized protein LOC129966790 isoform X1 n=2 Tax=Argiope bruennichi TaxID=94029 RepID=UPI002495A724|nr:uncharacterized protein LOC129966790 isoform X1 [Argiope bruennichi]